MTTVDGGRGRRLFIDQAGRAAFLSGIEHPRFDARPAGSFHSPFHSPDGRRGAAAVPSLAGLVAVPS